MSKHWVAQYITDTEAPARVEGEYEILPARERDGELGNTFWVYPLQDAIAARIEDHALKHGHEVNALAAMRQRRYKCPSVIDEDMTPFADRPDAVGGA